MTKRTKIVIEHEGDALKDHQLWQLVQELLFGDGPVSVVEIAAEDDDDE